MNLNFGQAIEALKIGVRVCRIGWNGKGMWLGYKPGFDVERAAALQHESWMLSKQAAGVTSRLSETGEELMVPYAVLSEAAKDLDRNQFHGQANMGHPYIYMSDVAGKLFPWTPNMLDMLAEDWMTLDPQA